MPSMRPGKVFVDISKGDIGYPWCKRSTTWSQIETRLDWKENIP